MRAAEPLFVVTLGLVVLAAVAVAVAALLRCFVLMARLILGSIDFSPAGIPGLSYLNEVLAKLNRRTRRILSPVCARLRRKATCAFFWGASLMLLMGVALTVWQICFPIS